MPVPETRTRTRTIQQRPCAELKRLNVFGLLCLLITILLALCGCQEEDLLGQGILVVGLEANPTNLDPRLSTDAASSRINELLYSRLFRKNEAGEPVEDIVEEWEQTDPTTYRFRIRKGIRFHDGRPLDARDVRYTFRSMMDPALGSPLRSSYQMIESIECPDPHTLLFRLERALRLPADQPGPGHSGTADRAGRRGTRARPGTSEAARFSLFPGPRITKSG